MFVVSTITNADEGQDITQVSVLQKSGQESILPELNQESNLQYRVLQDDASLKDRVNELSATFIELSNTTYHEKNAHVRPYIDLASGTELGVTQAYSSLGLFTCVPTNVSNSSSHLWLYTDVCWHHFLKGTNGASGEGGFLWGNNERFFGAYVGYDWRRWRGNSFDQISAGVQMKCCPWEVCANVNCPLREKAIICCSVFKFDGGFKSTLKEFDAAYGVASITIARYFCTCLPCVNFAFGIEPYYLWSGNRNICSRDRNGWGGRGKLLFNVCGALNIEVSVSHDNIFESRAQIAVGIDLLQLFCGCSCDNSCYLHKAFQRQRVVAVKRKESWKHNW